MVLQFAARSATAALALVLLSVLAPRTEAGVLDLGTTPGSLASYVSAVSGDGQTAVGRGTSPTLAFRWTPAGISSLGTLPGSTNSEATGVNFDGSAIVGRCGTGSSQSNDRAFLWRRSSDGNTGTMQPLGVPSGMVYSQARGVSADASAVCVTGGTTATSRAYRWTPASGGSFQDLGVLPGYARSTARAISRDGSAVVGHSSSSTSERAFRWTAPSGMQSLGDSLGVFSAAVVTNPDGSIVAGNYTESDGWSHVFRWTATEGMQPIPDAPNTARTIVYGMSDNGNAIVGAAGNNAYSIACLWTPSLGTVNLNTYLTSIGISRPAGWTLTSAEGISADGMTIVGRAQYGVESYASWTVTLPSPSTAALLLLAAPLSLRRRR